MGTFPRYLANLIRIFLPMLILAIGIGGLTAIYKYGRPQTLTRPPEAPLPPLVETVPVVAQTDGLDLDVDGIVVPHRVITLATEVAGEVVEKSPLCQAGCYVPKGTLLVKIDPRDYEIEVRRLTEQHKQAGISLAELDVQIKNIDSLIEIAKKNTKLIQREVGRLTKLSKKNYVTESALDAERRNELAAQNSLIVLENQLRVYRIQRERLLSARELNSILLEKARLELERTEIRAPIDGMIVRDEVEKDDFLPIGKAVAEMEDVSKVEVHCNLRMKQLYWVLSQGKKPLPDPSKVPGARSYQLPPTPTTVIYRLNDKAYRWNGVLTRYRGIGIDETTRTVPCTVIVLEPDRVHIIDTEGKKIEEEEGQAWQGPEALVRGMFVDLIIHTKPKSPLLRVPEKAIRPGNRVWAVRDNRLHVVPVYVVGVSGETAIVQPRKKGQLNIGDQVVVVPMAFVEDGMEVRQKEEKTPSQEETKPR